MTMWNVKPSDLTVFAFLFIPSERDYRLPRDYSAKPDIDARCVPPSQRPRNTALITRLMAAWATD